MTNLHALLKVVSVLQAAIFCPPEVVINFCNYPFCMRSSFSQAHFRESTDKSGGGGGVLEALSGLGLVYVHEVYTGTERGVLTIQEYILNQVLTIRVGLCT